MKFIVDQIATPRLADTGSRRLPDSPIRRVGDSPNHRCGESTKGKIIALDLYVCLLLQASLVPWNPFLGSLNVSKYGLRLSPGIDSKELIPLANVA